MCTGIEFSYMAKNKGNSDLVREKNVSNGEPYLFTESFCKPFIFKCKTFPMSNIRGAYQTSQSVSTLVIHM